jgi:23S rRNA (cytidine1920-2'-O)/16S rRNA (cytidine1409-2'-O)-methyltransferase
MPDNAERQRLDQALVARGLALTRSRARDAILRGHVRIDGVAAERASLMVGPEARIELADPASSYVSRAALKLVAGLDHFGYDPAGETILDLGTSTGGFAEVLLRRGAGRIYGVDVGHGQLHPRLAAEARLISTQGLNARDLTREHVPEEVGAITADLSFISLRIALPPALALARSGAFAVLLFKPQFEVGREGIGKGGLVRDPIAAEGAALSFTTWLEQRGWKVDGMAPSPIAGGDGNREFLIGARLV